MKKLILKYKEIILYIFFGGITTLINWAAYAIMSYLFSNISSFDDETIVIYSNIIAWIIAFIFAFFVNKFFVFENKNKDNIKREFFNFFLSRTFTGVLEIVLVPFLVHIGINQTIFGVKGFVSKIIVTVIVTILNYVFGKLVFKKKSN